MDRKKDEGRIIVSRTKDKGTVGIIVWIERPIKIKL